MKFPMGPTTCTTCDSLVTEIPGGQGITKEGPYTLPDGTITKWLVYEDTTKYSCPKCGKAEGVKMLGPPCYLDLDAGIINAPYIPDILNKR